MSNLSGYSLLLQYCNSKLGVYRQANIIRELSDFSKSWCTGSSLLCLVHSYAEDKIPGLTQYITGSTVHTSSSPVTIDTSKGEISLESFPNPPITDVKSEFHIKRSRTSISDNCNSSNNKSNSVNHIKYLLFSGYKQASKECMETALLLAKNFIGVPAIISADQMIEGTDELSTLTYLSEFFWITDVSKDFKFTRPIESADVAGYMDKFISDYVNEASNLLYIFLTLSENHYNFVSVIQGESESTFLKSHCHRNDWFYPIINCINDPNCSVDKLKYVSNKVIRTTEQKISEKLGEVCQQEEKSSNNSNSKTPTVSCPRIMNDMQENLLYSAISKISYLRRAYKDIFNYVNDSDNDNGELSQNNECKDRTIVPRDLSNLTFLHEQINKQLEEFLFGAFTNAKKAINNYISFIMVSKAELDSLEEELTGRDDRIGGILSEATLIVSEIKELSSLKDHTYQNNNRCTPSSAYQATIVAQQKQYPATLTNANVDTLRKNNLLYPKTIIVGDTNKNILDKGDSDVTNYSSDSKFESGRGSSKYSLNTLVNDVLAKHAVQLCEECTKWMELSDNSLLLIYFIVQCAYNKLLGQTKSISYNSNYKSCFGKGLNNTYYGKVPKCCISALLGDIYYGKMTIMGKSIDDLGNHDHNYLSDMYSTLPTRAERLTALLLTSQNMVTRAKYIVDILKARFFSSQGINDEGKQSFYSSKQSASPSAMFPKSVRDQVKRLIHIAEVEIVQYLMKNTTVEDMNKITSDNDHSSLMRSIPTVPTVVDGINRDILRSAEDSNSCIMAWRRFTADIENYCKRCLLLETQLMMYYTDIEMIGVERRFHSLSRRHNRSITIQNLEDTSRIIGHEIFGAFNGKELTAKLDEPLKKGLVSNLNTSTAESELEILDRMWDNIASAASSCFSSGKKISPHASIKTLLSSVKISLMQQNGKTSSDDDFKLNEIDYQKLNFSNTTEYLSVSHRSLPSSAVYCGSLKISSATLVDNDGYLSDGIEILNNKSMLSSNIDAKQVSPEVVSNIPMNNLPRASPRMESVTLEHSSNKCSPETKINGLCTDLSTKDNTTGEQDDQLIKSVGTTGVLDNLLDATSLRVSEELEPQSIFKIKEVITDDIKCQLSHVYEAEGEHVKEDTQNSNLISFEEPHVDEERLLSIFRNTLCKFDKMLQIKRKFFFAYEISLDEITFFNMSLCSFTEELKVLSERFVHDLLELYNESDKSTLELDIFTNFSESTDPTSLFDLLSSIRIDIPLSLAYLIVNYFCQKHDPVRDMFYRIKHIYYFIRKEVDFVKDALEYMNAYNKYGEKIFIELKRLEDIIINNVESGEIIDLELNDQVLNAARNHLKSLNKRIKIKAHRLSNFQKPLVFNQDDMKVIDRIKLLTVHDLKGIIESEYRVEIKTSISLVTKVKLAVCELSIFYKRFKSFITNLENDATVEMNTSLPSNIITKKLELYVSNNPSELRISINDLDKFLQASFTDNIGTDIIKESKLRQSRRFEHYKNLESIAHKVLNIANEPDVDIFKLTRSTVEESINAASTKLKDLDNLSEEIRIIADDHVIFAKHISEIMNNLINDIKYIKSTLNNTVDIVSDEVKISNISVNLVMEYVEKLKCLSLRADEIYTMAQTIEDEIIASYAPRNRLNKLLNTTTRCSSSPVIDSECTLAVATLVKDLMITSVDSIRQDIASRVYYVINRYISFSEDAIIETINGNFTKIFREALGELYPVIKTNLNMEAYIHLNCVKAKSLLLELHYLNNGLLAIDEIIELLHTMYVYWKSLVTEKFSALSHKHFCDVNRKYRNIISNYATIVLEFSNLYKTASVCICLTDLAKLIHDSLNTSHSSTQQHLLIDEDKLEQLFDVRLKVIDSAINSFSKLSNLVLNCSDLHAFSYISCRWLCDKAVIMNIKPSVSSTIKKDFDYTEIISRDLDICEQNARKINSLAYCIISLIITEKTSCVEFCHGVLQKIVDKKGSSQEDEASELSHSNIFITAIRLIGETLYKYAKCLIMARKNLFNHNYTTGTETELMFSVYKRIVSGNGNNDSEFSESVNILDICDKIENSLRYLSMTISSVSEEIIELIRCLTWAEGALEICVPGIKALITQIKSYSSPNNQIDNKLCSENSRLTGYWSGIVGAWNSQVYQVLSSGIIHRVLQNLTSSTASSDIDVDMGYISANTDSYNTLLKVENQKCFVMEQEFIQTLKTFVESILSSQLKFLNDTYEYTTNVFQNTAQA